MHPKGKTNTAIMLNEHSNKSVDTKPITNQQQKMRDFEILSPKQNVCIFPFSQGSGNMLRRMGLDGGGAKATKEG